jgi:hypothetical protein
MKLKFFPYHSHTHFLNASHDCDFFFRRCIKEEKKNFIMAALKQVEKIQPHILSLQHIFIIDL